MPMPNLTTSVFHNHGGYEFAQAFYAEAYRAAVDIVGGEQYILSAVMHADERNQGMSKALGYDVWHYHLHVIYVPVVEKQILWSKRCKDPALVGTVKETIMQVSHSKKWQSRPVLDEFGEPLRTKTGKIILKKSYSVLQDQYHDAMFAAGYTDVERGERGSTEEHLTTVQFKVRKEQEALDTIMAQQQSAEQAVRLAQANREEAEHEVEATKRKVDALAKNEPPAACEDISFCESCPLAHICGECRRIPTDIDIDEELDSLIQRKEELASAKKEYDQVDKEIKQKVGEREKLITGHYLIERKSFVKKSYTVPESTQYRINIKRL